VRSGGKGSCAEPLLLLPVSVSIVEIFAKCLQGTLGVGFRDKSIEIFVLMGREAKSHFVRVGNAKDVLNDSLANSY